MTEEISNSSKSKSGAFIVIIALMAMGLAFMTFLWSQKNGEINDLNNVIKKQKVENKELSELVQGFGVEISNDIQKDLKVALATFDEMKAKGIGDDDSLAMYRQKVEELMVRAKRGDWSARELANMRKENESLREILREYVVKVDSLNTLTTKLSADLEVSQNDLNLTKTELDKTTTELDQAYEKVKEGQKLQAFTFTSGGMKEKLNSTLTETTKARNCVQFYSSFTISENSLTSKGRKEVYMQIIGPNGKTLQSSSSNIVQTESGKIPYSDKNEIDYQNQRIDLTVYYRLGNATAEKGNYKVRIYCQGQLIGTDSFTLK